MSNGWRGVPVTLLGLAGSIAPLLWGVRMVQTGVQRAYGAQLRTTLGSPFAGPPKRRSSPTASRMCRAGFNAAGLPHNLRASGCKRIDATEARLPPKPSRSYPKGPSTWELECGSASQPNASRRLEARVTKGGFTYGSHSCIPILGWMIAIGTGTRR